MIISGVDISSAPGMRTQLGRSKADEPGPLYAWGNNNFGTLGDNTNINKSSPVQTIGAGANWTQVSVSCGASQFAGGIKSDGTLWAWGNNQFGMLGDNTVIRKSSPVQTVAGGTNWSQIATGYSMCAAIKTDGTLWTWGRNNSGQIGNSSGVASFSSPVQTSAGGTTWRTVSASNESFGAIKTDGTLWMWGSNSVGSPGILGDNTTINKSSPVQTTAAGTNWSKISFGETHAAAIKTDGTLWVWGSNGNGELGNADATFATKSSPVQTISSGTDWQDIKLGRWFSIALKTNGTLWTWGSNQSGKLGDNSNISTSSPIQTVAGGSNWSFTAGGKHFSAAIKTDGTLWTWGQNNYGPLGDNTSIAKSSPVQTIAGGTNWTSVSAGGYSILALTLFKYAE